MQLLADARPSLPMKPGFVRRQDYEYIRCGTRNFFLFLEPKVGERHLLVTRHRTKEDFAKAMRYLVDELYPDVPLIDLVVDNLNTHTPEAVIEIFGKTEADRILARLVFHYTPLHSSWVNAAEIDLSVLTRQCLAGRIPDEWTLGLEGLAWEARRNQQHQPIAWSFNWKRARRLFGKRQGRASHGPATGQN